MQRGLGIVIRTVSPYNTPYYSDLQEHIEGKYQKRSPPNTLTMNPPTHTHTHFPAFTATGKTMDWCWMNCLSVNKACHHHPDKQNKPRTFSSVNAFVFSRWNSHSRLICDSTKVLYKLKPLNLLLRLMTTCFYGEKINKFNSDKSAMLPIRIIFRLKKDQPKRGTILSDMTKREMSHRGSDRPASRVSHRILYVSLHSNNIAIVVIVK